MNLDIEPNLTNSTKINILEAQLSNPLIESDADKSRRQEDYDNYISTSSSSITSDEGAKEGPMVKNQNLLLNIIEEMRQPYLDQTSNPLTKTLLFDIPEKDSFKIPKQNLCKSKL